MAEPDRYADIGRLRRRYARGELSPTEFVADTLARAEALNPRLSAFITIAHEQARAQAVEAERRIRELGAAAWDRQPLLGVPISVKDLTATRGIRTTRGSARLRDHVPDSDAPAVARLRAAGAIIIGKTNTSEFGWSAATRNRLVPPTANPWNHDLSAGGSSGGAAAAVARGLGAAALGTDGAGSIRIPASFCGIVGLKPTYGRIPYAPWGPDRLSHIGPMTRTVSDAALLLGILSGPDERDPDSAPAPSTAEHPPPLRVGWVTGLGSTSDSERLARNTVASLEELGCRIEDIDVPFADPYPALVTIIAAAEAAGSPPEHDESADPDRLRIVEHGRRLTAAELLRAQEERIRLTQRLHECMRRFDLLAMPTVAARPFGVDALRPDPAGDELSWLAWSPASYPFNLSGQPALSLPAGFDADGLPVGVQLVGRTGQDGAVIRAALEIEKRAPWHDSYAHEG